ncbi:hypothetical protein FOPG_18234 [Fusarium oxysporum f. sp. conglutinans race 2 54008]|uniref:Uncharacterized protein n=1 Tax=Fusarium oxysporum f. sp. conglutinans race 2 54008 TaxID=1089457 RepID=X0GQE3_FUSOX|nr:hypothetical protein FOPG_18234 [Fusarium oxysporum f. sp. conglutinans race 2 54008]
MASGARAWWKLSRFCVGATQWCMTNQRKSRLTQSSAGYIVYRMIT